MQKKKMISDSLTGLVLKRVLDAASSQQGMRLQPLVNDNQEAVAEPVNISRLVVDREKNCLKVQLRGDNKEINTWAGWSLFRLVTKHRNLLHESNSLAVLYTELGEDKLTLTLEMPKQLTKVFNREYFRIYLGTHLVLPVSLHLDNLTISGTLEDYSAGGCRVALSPQLALHLLRPLEQPLRITITFPNGKTLTTPFEMTYLQPQNSFLYALVGCHFQHESLQEEKAFMHYAFEIEREVARLSNVERTVKHKSSLFDVGETNQPKKAHQRSKVTSITDKIVPKAAQLKIKALADQLALQALLLAMNQKLEANRFKPLAIEFIEALDTHGNTTRLALQQSYPAINPVILHTLRVISHCFPLAFKMGIRRGMELPVMMSLLIHDLGKLFVSEQPCFNPLKLPAEKLRLMKHNQIQLLRAATALRWIPPSIGESLLVNANERLDGSGYPRGLKQEKLDALSRLVAVCKVLDCLVHGYNDPAMRWRDAYKWVHKHQQWFDLPMLRYFVQHFGLRPLASHVVYSGGFVACVTEVGKQGEILEVMLLKSAKHPTEVIQGRRVNTPADFAKLGKIKGTLGPI